MSSVSAAYPNHCNNRRRLMDATFISRLRAEFQTVDSRREEAAREIERIQHQVEKLDQLALQLLGTIEAAEALEGTKPIEMVEEVAVEVAVEKAEREAGAPVRPPSVSEVARDVVTGRPGKLHYLDDVTRTVADRVGRQNNPRLKANVRAALSAAARSEDIPITRVRAGDRVAYKFSGPRL